MNSIPRTLFMTRPAPASTRQRRYPPSPTAPRNITKENSPKRVRPQAPTDIGEYGLNTGVPDTESTSMCQKRKGCPRSSVSRMGQISSSGKLMMNASREAALSAGLPHSRSMVPITKAPPEMPAKKKYRRMYHSQCGGEAKSSFGISPHPPPPRGGEGVVSSLRGGGR